MEPHIVELEDLYVNMSNLLWAKIHRTREGKLESIELHFNSKENVLVVSDLSAVEVYVTLQEMARLALDKLPFDGAVR